MHHEILQLGIALVFAGLLVRMGSRFNLPSIPFLIVAGIALGPHSPGPIVVHEPEEIYLLATLGLVFLLFHLGLEFSVDDLVAGGRKLALAGGSYIAINFGAGIALGVFLDWGWRETFVIAGMIGTSSSAIVTKLLVELGRLGNRESGMILGIIVVEDVFLAAYLAMLQPVLLGETDPVKVGTSIAIAFSFLIGLFILARRGGRLVARLVGSSDDERLIVMCAGFALLIAGIAGVVGASDAIGALLAGMVVGGTVWVRAATRVVTPLRDLFSAIFFFWFGTTIEPSSLSDIAMPVVIGVVLSLLLNLIAGIVAAWIYGYGRMAATNTASLLVSRGEFELILAALAVSSGLDPRVAAFAALYVLVLSIASPILASRSRTIGLIIPRRLLPADRAALARSEEA